MTLKISTNYFPKCWGEGETVADAEDFKYKRVNLGGYSQNRRGSWQHQLHNQCLNIQGGPKVGIQHIVYELLYTYFLAHSV